MSWQERVSVNGESLTARVGAVGAGRTIAVISLFCIDLLLTRTLTQEEFGTYRQIWLIFNIASPIALLGMASSLLYFLPRFEPSRQAPFLTQSALLLLVTAGAVTVCLHAASSLFARGFAAPELPAHLGAFLPYAFAATASGFLDPLLFALGRTFAYAAFTAGTGLLMLGAAAVTAALHLDLNWLLLMMSGIAIVRLATAYAFAAGVGRLRFRGVLDGALLREHIVYSSPIWLADVIGIASRWTDKVIVSSLFTPDRYAIYAVGATEIPFVGVLLASMRAILTPELARRHHCGDVRGLLSEWHNGIVKMALVVLPLFFFLILFAGQVVPLLYSARYADSVTPFYIYLFLLPVRVAFYGVVLIATGRSGLLFWSALGDLVLNAGLGICLAFALGRHSASLGMLGPAIATVVATYTEVAVLLLLIRRDLRVGWGEILPWRELWRLTWISVAAGAACLPLKLAFVNHAVWQLAAGGCTFSMVYLYLTRWRRGSRRLS